MKSGTRYRAVIVCALGLLGGCLAGCSHKDAEPENTAKAPVMPSGMPPEAQQQTLQAQGAASPAALAAEHNAAMRKSKP